MVNAHHEMIELEALAVEVLKLADGRRRRSDILDALVERFERGTLEMEDGGAPVTDASAARTILADRLASLPSNDAELAAAIGAGPVVLGLVGTAETTGKADSKMALATISSLNAQRSSRLPPPRVTRIKSSFRDDEDSDHSFSS